MNHIVLPSIVLLLSMATCAAIPPPPEATSVAAGSCDAFSAGWVVGDEPTPDVIERARLESGSPVVRVITPGQALATEYRPERLNISTDEGGTIAGLSCG